MSRLLGIEDPVSSADRTDMNDPCYRAASDESDWCSNTVILITVILRRSVAEPKNLVLAQKRHLFCQE